MFSSQAGSTASFYNLSWYGWFPRFTIKVVLMALSVHIIPSGKYFPLRNPVANLPRDYNVCKLCKLDRLFVHGMILHLNLILVSKDLVEIGSSQAGPLTTHKHPRL
jgi:hypothetical protein